MSLVVDGPWHAQIINREQRVERSARSDNTSRVTRQDVSTLRYNALSGVDPRFSLYNAKDQQQCVSVPLTNGLSIVYSFRALPISIKLSNQTVRTLPIYSAVCETLKLDNQKNGWKGVCINHEHNGDAILCAIRVLGRRYMHIRKHTSDQSMSPTRTFETA